MSGLNYAASAPAAYASRVMSPPPLQSSLPAGWLGLDREGVEHSGSLQKVSDQSLILLFWICPGAREVSLNLPLPSRHSITSSASESRLSEIWMPSAFAVLTLITNSNFVGSITGR